jgi:hypothetical protein
MNVGGTLAPGNALAGNRDRPELSVRQAVTNFSRQWSCRAPILQEWTYTLSVILNLIQHQANVVCANTSASYAMDALIFSFVSAP